LNVGVSCDIFCRVVDNFGDIGVTWRLARQLSQEYKMVVRLVVDDLASLNAIEPRISPSIGRQETGGIIVMDWEQAAAIVPADLVIEAFAVNLPVAYVGSMAATDSPPAWINLEHLSAESWVDTHHLLPSPHPVFRLTKYFFFPGFAPNTGGLIRERNLLNDRDRFIAVTVSTSLRVFLFAYANAAGDGLVDAITGLQPDATCTVVEGAFTETLKKNPAIERIRFAPQQDFDRLLWRHDVLFVRGEDSFVRAQWAAKPFVWQIYRQSENAHWVKLNAFLAIYCKGLGCEPEAALRELWRAWNAEDGDNIGVAWQRFMQHLPVLQIHAIKWSQKLAELPDLAANLLSFYQKNTKI
jgi:uncharacterized repeat protein (TIGR03837 family)